MADKTTWNRREDIQSTFHSLQIGFHEFCLKIYEQLKSTKRLKNDYGS